MKQNAIRKEAISAGVLVSSRRQATNWLVLMVSFWPVIVSALQQIPGMPSVVKFTVDVVLVCVVILTMLRGELVFQRRITPLVAIAGAFFICSLIGFLGHYQSPFYYLWGLRNNARFFIAFFIYTATVTEKGVEQWFKILDWLFWINAALSVIQFIWFGARQDYLGGIFGISGGTNGYTLTLFLIVMCKSLLNAFGGEEPIKKCMLKCGTALIIAAMAELKFFYICFLAILGLSAVITHFSWKKVAFLAVSAFAVSLAASLLVYWFGFEDFLSIENILEKAFRQNYSSKEDLNRFAAIAGLSERFMPTAFDQLFGLGLGNCDTSAFAFCNSVFFQKYSYLHYSWFTAPMVFLETGYVGLCLYMAFFITCFFMARKQLKWNTHNVLILQMAVVLIPIYCVVAFYNSSLRIESAYMMYFILALPFIQKEKKGAASEMISEQEKKK